MKAAPGALSPRRIRWIDVVIVAVVVAVWLSVTGVWLLPK